MRRTPGSPARSLVLLGGLAALICLGPGVSAPATAGGGAASAGASCGPTWVGAWHASPVPVREPPAADGRIGGRTVRLVVRPQVDGSALRIRISHQHGSVPLVLGAASAGPVADGPAVRHAVPIRFGGLAGTVLAPGGGALSDPVDLDVVRGEALAISLFLPTEIGLLSEHPVALQTSYVSRPGDHTTDLTGDPFDRTLGSWPLLGDVEVRTPRATNAVVLVGDSITDGVGSATDRDTRYSDRLAERLAAAGGDRRMAVLNAGIAGNRLRTDEPFADGDPPVQRLPADVETPSRVTDVVLHAGTNDVADGSSAAEIIRGLRDYADRVRAADRRVFLTTITPSSHPDHGGPAADAARAEVNDWVRTTGAAHTDGMFDFAAAVADPDDPRRLAAPFDSGDGLHPSEAGYARLARAVDPARLTGSPCLDERP